jgi:type II secretory pathway pseudopilin PulG
MVPGREENLYVLLRLLWHPSRSQHPHLPPVRQPPTGVRQPAAVVKGPSSGLPIILILVFIGGFFLLAVVGILAAILIPNFLDALQKAKQKRTVAEIRRVGTAVVSYMTDGNGALPVAQDLEELRPVLVPRYLQSLPVSDGWKRPFWYSCWKESSKAAGCDHFRIVSGGQDGKLSSEDLSQYVQGPFEPTDYDQDIVFGDGLFLRYPLPGGQR